SCVRSTIAVTRQSLDLLARESENGPLVHWLGAERLVELDRGSVPVQHRPLHAATPALVGDLRERDEQRLAQALAARRRTHVEVLEVQPVTPQPRGVVHEEEGEALGDPVELADEGFARRPAPAPPALAEERIVDHLLGGLDGLGVALVFRELADEAEDAG